MPTSNTAEINQVDPLKSVWERLQQRPPQRLTEEQIWSVLRACGVQESRPVGDPAQVNLARFENLKQFPVREEANRPGGMLTRALYDYGCILANADDRAKRELAPRYLAAAAQREPNNLDMITTLSGHVRSGNIPFDSPSADKAKGLIISLVVKNLGISVDDWQIVDAAGLVERINLVNGPTRKEVFRALRELASLSLWSGLKNNNLNDLILAEKIATVRLASRGLGNSLDEILDGILSSFRDARNDQAVASLRASIGQPVEQLLGQISRIQGYKLKICRPGNGTGAEDNAQLKALRDSASSLQEGIEAVLDGLQRKY